MCVSKQLQPTSFVSWHEGGLQRGCMQIPCGATPLPASFFQGAPQRFVRSPPGSSFSAKQVNTSITERWLGSSQNVLTSARKPGPTWHKKKKKKPVSLQNAPASVPDVWVWWSCLIGAKSTHPYRGRFNSFTLHENIPIQRWHLLDRIRIMTHARSMES